MLAHTTLPASFAGTTIRAGNRIAPLSNLALRPRSGYNRSMSRRRRRRELFPPDRRLQLWMVLASVLTPLVVLAAVTGVVEFLPLKLAIGVGVAAAIGVVAAVRSRKASSRGRELPPDEAPELHAAVDRLSAMADIPRPVIVLEYERQPNSWVTDSPGRSPRLHVTRALLDTLEGPELEAVAAHELAHIANRDATVMTVVGGPGAVLLNGGRRMTSGGAMWAFQLGGVAALGIGLLSRVGTSALSRHRELAADAGAAALTGRPAALASALMKISGELARVPAQDLRAVAGRDSFHLLPVEAPPRGGLEKLGHQWPFDVLGATHPDLQKRIAALERLERRMHAARPSSGLLS